MSRKNLKGSKMSFDKYCASYKFDSIRPKSLFKTQFFEKGNLSSEEKILAYFFSYYRILQAPRNKLKGSARSSGNYCGSITINSLGPKRLLKTKTFEKERQNFQ